MKDLEISVREMITEKKDQRKCVKQLLVVMRDSEAPTGLNSCVLIKEGVGKVLSVGVWKALFKSTWSAPLVRPQSLTDSLFLIFPFLFTVFVFRCCFSERASNSFFFLLPLSPSLLRCLPGAEGSTDSLCQKPLVTAVQRHDRELKNMTVSCHFISDRILHYT